jgi:hypothetical protein
MGAPKTDGVAQTRRRTSSDKNSTSFYSKPAFNITTADNFTSALYREGTIKDPHHISKSVSFTRSDTSHGSSDCPFSIVAVSVSIANPRKSLSNACARQPAAVPITVGIHAVQEASQPTFVPVTIGRAAQSATVPATIGATDVNAIRSIIRLSDQSCRRIKFYHIRVFFGWNYRTGTAPNRNDNRD